MSLSKIQWRNKFTFDEAVQKISLSIVAHPFDYVKILIQLGYEPFQPYETTTIFMRKRLALPGLFTYLSLIRQEDGFFGMFRGIQYKIAGSLVSGFVCVNVADILEQLDAQSKENTSKGQKAKEETEINAKTIQKFLNTLMQITTSKCVALAVSYPLQLLVIRSCSEFVGRETTYRWLPSAIRDVTVREGFLGLYSGFMPKLIHECLGVWISHTLIFVVTGLINPDASVKSYISATISFVVQSVLYPFQVVSTVMAVNGSPSLLAAHIEPQFVNWTDCWHHLSRMGSLKRGSSLFWRQPPQPVNGGSSKKTKSGYALSDTHLKLQ